jgi:branched-chain amino acid transport system substrate-binding protein
MKALLCAGAVVALSAAACGGSGGGSSTTSSSTGTGAAGSTLSLPGGDIKVGAIVPLSGPLAGPGAGIKAALTAFVNEANTAGGIDGHKLDLIVENDGNDPATGVVAARKLKSEGVVASFATGLAAVEPQALPVLMKEKIVVIANLSDDQYAGDITKYPYFFATQATDSANMENMAKYAQTQGVTKVGVITDGLPFSLGNKTGFEAAARKLGLNIVSEVTYSPTAVDLSTQVSKLKAAGAQAIAATAETQFGELYKAVKQLNWDPLILTNNVAPLVDADQATDKTVYACIGAVKPGETPPAGELQAVTTMNSTGVKGVGKNTAVIYRDEVQLFIQAVKKAGGLDPGKLKAAIESFTNVSPTSPNYSYTYTAASHAGWAGPLGQCRIGVVSPNGLPVLQTQS